MPDPLILRCPACGTNNRVPREKIASGLTPVCGKCKSPLPLPSEPLIVTDANFPVAVEQSPLPVLLDMWAPWCGPCHMIAPVISQLAAEMPDRVRVAKLNIEENPVSADRFAIQGIPCLLILKGGRELDRIVGVQPKAEIVRRLNQALGN